MLILNHFDNHLGIIILNLGITILNLEIIILNLGGIMIFVNLFTIINILITIKWMNLLE